MNWSQFVCPTVLNLLSPPVKTNNPVTTNGYPEEFA
jgi:hypothetical protein